MIPTTRQLERFMRESNWIEGEKTNDTLSGDVQGELYVTDIAAAQKFLFEAFITEESLKELHLDLSIGRDIKTKGDWRKCDVSVGGYSAPFFWEINDRMAYFFSKLEQWDSWEAHNDFEKTHPFEDLNGRTGRLMWLHKALEEGYKFELSFLHKYYYQTLNHV